MKKNVEIKISGDSYLRHLKSVCRKVIDCARTSDEDFLSYDEFYTLRLFYFVLSDALKIFDKEDVKDAKNDMPNL